MKKKTPRWLGQAARRSSERSWTLGAVLQEYVRMEQISREHLAALLECDAESLEWMSLCLKPSREQFADDVSKIARRFNANASQLAQIVRRVETVGVLRQSNTTTDEQALLLAARDREGENDK